MTATATHEIFKLVGYIETDLRNTLAKLTELRAQLAALPIPAAADKPKCPICDVQRPTQQLVDEHVWVIHNASEPALDPQRA